MIKWILLILTLTACGTYRSGSGGYQSTSSGWRAPSDYTRSPSGGYTVDPKLEPGQTYIPRGEFRLRWPVANVRINRGFRVDPVHQGVDLGGSKNTPILAAHEGVVVYTGRDFSGYGNMVLIEYNKQWATLYGHLNEFYVREGRIVKAGDPIGGMGNTGRSTGVHLHFELIRHRNPVDPVPFLYGHGSRLARR